VWDEFSEKGLLFSRDDLAANLRSWLEYVPEKLLFGTDAYPYSPETGWQETIVASAAAGRRALGLALTQMMRENEITSQRAEELAKMVLRDNARVLYKLP
jgi:predicted TIM-barrel fold metal-dependent hydrolase